jgi:hypothetical protein
MSKPSIYASSALPVPSLRALFKATLTQLVLAFSFAFAAANAAQAQDFVFESSSARLSIQPSGIADSMTERKSGKEQLQPGGQPFAVIRKNGHGFPATSLQRSGALYRVEFGSSGVVADYRITASADYIKFELAAVHGDGVEQVTILQLGIPQATASGVSLAVKWNDDFSVSLMGLSDQVDTEVSGSALTASVYPGFSMEGQSVVLVATPNSQFLSTVQRVEQDFHLPYPTIGGRWAKSSTDVRTSYLFTDLTEANVDETIRYAKMGGFRYVLIYSSTWSASLGSYPINLRSFPHGEAGLKLVIDKCHAAGLKVGMHMLTSLVAKNDPLVVPKPDPGLLKGSRMTLTTNLSAQSNEIEMAPAPGDFHQIDGPADFAVNDEIVHCNQTNATKLLNCQRGYTGTTPSIHQSGTQIQQLMETSGAYLADLRSPLAATIADRIAGLINRVGFDMIYFDGGELSSANGPSWYWMGALQTKIWERSRRDLLVQGSGITDWTWHIFSRGTCDDYSAVATKQYLDLHKIAEIWRYLHNSFMPAELGWVGFLQEAPDHPATTPDEMEYYAVRMLALDSAVSLETSLNTLKGNGRSEEMLKLLGDYEQLRLSGKVSESVRHQLSQGEWHMTTPGQFHPIRYDAQRVTIPGEITVNNQFEVQHLNFRLQAEPQLAAPGDPSNIPLLRSPSPVELRPPAAQDAMPGALIQRIVLNNATQDQSSVFLVGPNNRTPGKALDLTTHRGLAVQLETDGPPQAAGDTPVLNVQLEAGAKTYRDYYIDLNSRGVTTVILPEPGTSRMLAEFRPSPSDYPFKAAMYAFNYANIVALNLRWMRYPNGSAVRCRVISVEALAERNEVLSNLEISAGPMKIPIPGEMNPGDYAEYLDQGPIRIFDRNGVLLRTVPAASSPVLKAGGNKLTVKASGPGTVKLTAITLGK